MSILPEPGGGGRRGGGVVRGTGVGETRIPLDEGVRKFAGENSQGIAGLCPGRSGRVGRAWRGKICLGCVQIVIDQVANSTDALTQADEIAR